MITLARPARSRNATLGILGIFLVGILITWLPVGLQLPLPGHPVDRTSVMALWQTLGMIVIPYYWAAKRLGLSPADLGLGRRGFLRSFGLACGLYTIALVAFAFTTHDPLIAQHPIKLLPAPKAMQTALTMFLIAAGTDVATRGFILLSLARHSSFWFAILMQNVFWLLGHTHEIRVLAGALGGVGAVGLFVVLGLLGDSIALRTRNVIGLGLAHVMLNVVMTSYIRWWL